MEFKTPFKLGDTVMGQRRTFGAVNSIAGEINIEKGLTRLTFSNIEGRSALDRAEDYREFKNKTEGDYHTIKLNPPYQLGSEVIYYSPAYGKVGRIQKGIVTDIQFNYSHHYTIFWYRVDGKHSVDRFNMYSSVEDFKKRTAPTKQLKANERYSFTQYLIQQNKLEPITVIEFGEVKSLVNHHGDREWIRNKYLHTTPEGFYNDMLEEINRK